VIAMLSAACSSTAPPAPLPNPAPAPTPAPAQPAWDSVLQFSGVQGQDGWFYRSYISSENRFEAEHMTYRTDTVLFGPPPERWEYLPPGAEPSQLNWPFVSSGRAHPGMLNFGGTGQGVLTDTHGREAARSWRAPASGNYNVTGQIGDFRADCNPVPGLPQGCDGIRFAIWINDRVSSPLYSKTFANAFPLEPFSLGTIALEAGDELHFVVFSLANGNSDQASYVVRIVR
jgi:hypothetical protein